MATNYKTKTKNVEAIQFIGTNWQEVFTFCGPMVELDLHLRQTNKAGKELWKIDGSILIGVNKRAAAVGYWILKDADGEMQVMTPEAFAEQYEIK